MALLEKQLVVKRSRIPAAGKGLFTQKSISKGVTIVEYIGNATTWKEVQRQDEFNGYVYYINRNRVLDAKKYTNTFARFANDANGITKIKGLRNNCCYVIEGDKVFVQALRNIDAGEELLVAYGKDYWDVIRHNIKHGYL